MGSSPDLPDGWDPDRDSLEDLVRIMFHDVSNGDRPAGSTAEPDQPRSEPAGHDRDNPRLPAAVNPTPASAPPPPAAPPPAEPFAGRRPQDGGRRAVPVLAIAILLVGAGASWQISSATASAPKAADLPLTTPAPSSPLVTTPATAAPVAALTTTPEPVPIGIPFGTRSDLGDGWRLAATRPYPCDVLMAIPVLQQDGTRIVRVTLTLTNRTDAAQPARLWELAATADRATAELVLWPSERFRGVPEVTLAPGRSVRFLVAVRVPENRTQLEITARRDAGTRAVFGGTV